MVSIQEQLSVDLLPERDISLWERVFCCKFKGAKRLSRQERLEIAKKRWREALKLRHLITSMTSAKEESDEVALSHYYGQIKDEKLGQGLLEKRCLIYPSSNWKTLIESIVAVLILYFSFVTPFRIGFRSDEENSEIIPYELVFDGALFVYIVLTFFMPYYEDIEIVDDHWSIASRYLRTLFFPDLISCLPFYLLNPNLMWLKILRLLRISGVSRLMENLLNFVSKASADKVVLDWHTKIMINRILQFVLYLAITCHCIACCWHYLAIKEGVPLKETWMQGVTMTDSEAYVASLYWTMVTFSTVGYGDITPKTDMEYVYAMVVEFIGILFFAYLMGNVSSIMNNMNERELAISQRENDLEKWLMMLDKNRPDKRLKPEMHSSIRNYFLYTWKHDHSFLINDSEFFMRMPSHLRSELTRHLFSDEVEKFGAFVDGCEEELKFQLVLNMFPRRFKKRQEVISEGSNPTEIFFIESGSVLLTIHHGSKVCLKLSNRCFFGDVETVFHTLLPASYQ